MTPVPVAAGTWASGAAVGAGVGTAVATGAGVAVATGAASGSTGSVATTGATSPVAGARVVVGAGGTIGEFSLLTGEPRSASVVALADTVAYEIEKGAMQLVLDGNPAVAEALSHAAAERRLRSQQSRDARPPEMLAEEHASLADQILAKMGTIFGRKRKPALT